MRKMERKQMSRDRIRYRIQEKSRICLRLPAVVYYGTQKPYHERNSTVEKNTSLDPAHALL